MERRELDEQTAGQTAQPGAAGSSRRCRRDRHIPAWGTRGQAETMARATQPVRLNYSFHSNKRKKSNQSSSLQTPEPSRSPGAGRQAGART